MKVWRRYTTDTDLPLWGVHRHRPNAVASAKETEAAGTAAKYGYGEIAVREVEYDDTMVILDE